MKGYLFVTLLITGASLQAREITMLDCVLGNSRFCNYVGQDTKEISAARKNLIGTKITRNVRNKLRPGQRAIKLKLIGQEALGNFQSMVGEVKKYESQGYKIDSFSFSNLNFETIMRKDNTAIALTAELSSMEQGYSEHKHLIDTRSLLDDASIDNPYFKAIGLKVEGESFSSGLAHIIFRI